MWYASRPMAILKKNAFSRRVPDLVTEELVAVLSRRASFEFKQLFDSKHENLRARNAASGGEEMLRLRAYEKLQNLVARGAVRKTGKKYKGLPSALAQAIAPQNGHLPAAAAAAANARNAAIARAAALLPPPSNIRFAYDPIRICMQRDYVPLLLHIGEAIGFAVSALLVSVLLGKAGRRTG